MRRHASRRRGVPNVAIGVMLIMTLFGCGRGRYDARTATAVITSPTDGTATPRIAVPIEGEVHGLRRGEHAFLVSTSSAAGSDRWFPQGAIETSPSGSWRRDDVRFLWEYAYSLFVVATTDAESMAYLSEGTYGVYGLPFAGAPPHTRVISPITRIRRVKTDLSSTDLGFGPSGDARNP